MPIHMSLHMSIHTSLHTSLIMQGVVDMFSGSSFPSSTALMSCNAYLGAFPIAELLRQATLYTCLCK